MFRVVIERLEQLGQGVEGRGFESWWSQPGTWKFSVFSTVTGTFYDSGEVTAGKGGR